MACTQCGAPVSVEQKFCNSCGTRIQSDSSVRTPDQAQVSPAAGGTPRLLGQLDLQTPLEQRKTRRLLFWGGTVFFIVLVIGAVLIYAPRGESKADVLIIDQAVALAKQNDFDKANQLLRPLAEAGVARAQYDLGDSYDNGEGVAQDSAQAAVWYRKAADQGFAPAQAALGSSYDAGTGVPKDVTQAATWFRKAADQGNARGEFGLGQEYEFGDGVEKDLGQALQWFEKAAAQGDIDAMTDTGILYINADGVSNNAPRGIALLQKAANLGDAKAQDALGQMYYRGIGVQQDLTQAVAWFGKSAQQGYEHARSALKDIQRQAAAAQKQAEEARMDYPQRYAASFTEAMLHGGICDNLAQLIIRMGNNTGFPENVRVMQMESIMRSAEQARCVPD